jgi:effector-binding domain-containing protein
MLKKMIFALLAIIVLYTVTCFFGPEKMDVITSAKIDGTPGQVYGQFIDYKNWPNWSKWIKEDTAMKLTYENPSSGVGGGYSWTSEKSGSGSMKTTEAVPNSLMKADLKFSDYNSTNAIIIELKPIENQTLVTWSMKDEKPFPFFLRGMMLFMNMNGSIKKDFDKGLANLNEYIKSGKAGEYLNGYTVVESQFPGAQYLGKRAKVKFSAIGNHFNTHFPQIAKLAGSNIAGTPAGLYWMWDEANQSTDMAAAMPISSIPAAYGDYSIFDIPASKEFVVDYYGAYEKTMSAYMAMDSIMHSKGYKNQEMVIEEYITDPMMEKDTAKWLTRIHFLVK